jgi:hypothetical protein
MTKASATQIIPWNRQERKLQTYFMKPFLPWEKNETKNMKKGSNYRPISLISVGAKILAKQTQQ